MQERTNWNQCEINVFIIAIKHWRVKVCTVTLCVLVKITHLKETRLLSYLLFILKELKCDAILTLLWRHAIVNCNTLGCGRYRVIIFSMVISVPKENASKTTNVGLYVNLSIVINSLRWHHIVCNMIFINLFTKLMNDSEKHDWMFWCDVCKGTCVCCIEMSFVGYVCNVNCMCVLL